MAVIQQSILGILQTAQTGVLFAKHTKKQNEQLAAQTEGNIQGLEKEISERSKAVKGLEAQVTGLTSEAKLAQSRVDKAYEEGVDPTVEDLETLQGLQDPMSGETLVPSAGEQIQSARAEITKEEEAIQKAEKRLQQQYKNLKRYGGKV